MNPALLSSKYGLAPDGSRISDNRFSSNPQQTRPTPYLTFAAVAGSIAGFNYLGKQTINGAKGYDWLFAGIRSAEEYSPGGFLRTFQLSNIFSQFTTEAQTEKVFKPEYFISNLERRAYWSKVIGGGHETVMRLMDKGVIFRQNALHWAKTGEMALPYAGFVLNTPITEHSRIAARFSAAYGRALGVHDIGRGGIWQLSNLEKYFAQAEPGETFARQLIGGRNLTQHVWRQFSAMGGEGVARFNRLLEMPLELPPGRQVFGAAQKYLSKWTGGAITLSHGLGVKQGSGLQTLGKLGVKWGIIAPLLYLGWQEIDRITRNAIPDEMPLGEGTNVALAGAWARGNIAASSIAQVTGAHALREWQEDVAPGSTSIAKLAALPIAGALGGATLMYGSRVAQLRGLRAGGLPIEIAGESARIIASKFKPGGILEKISTTLGRISPKFAPSTPMGTAAFVGAAAGLALVAPFIPGALVPSERPDELRDIYSGRQEVPIRKGRWWEAGSSSFEGGRIQRFQPHWFHRLRTRTTEYALWGPDADYMSEFEKWWRKEFTYDLERRHLQDRPYPVSSLPLEDFPLVGPILANTIGRLIKPPVEMHREDYINPSITGAEYLTMPGRFGETFNENLGQETEGVPISPYDLTGTAGEQIYRMTEMAGLPGFILSSIKESLTGSQDWWDERRRLESARKMHGMKRFYWDEELGGLLGASEFFRRLYPHRRRQIPQYNPIPNMMPTWLPGAGDKSENFRVGDPYSKISMGELRLPGPGYERLHPELEGVAPEDYGLSWKYKILSDVAPYSTAFKRVSGEIARAKIKGKLSEEEIRRYQVAKMQMQAVKKSRKTFYEYNYLKPYGDVTDAGTLEGQVLAAINEASKQSKTGGMINTLFGGYWEWISHGTETAIEQLTPISPVGKFMHVRDPVEDYEKTVLYGRDMRLWQNPVQHFVKPFANSLARSFGWAGIPSQANRIRQEEAYFDVLEYVKAKKLEQNARTSGNYSAAKEYKSQAGQTTFGVNPYTRNIGQIFKAFPRRERNYFTAFAAAQEPEKRAKILEMVPENLRSIYIAQWQNQYMDKAQEAMKKNLIDSETAQKVQAEISQIREQRDSGGFPMTEDLRREYFRTKLPGESYADWFRRKKILPQRLRQRGLPGPSWVGFHPSVDMEDVKLKVVQDMAENMHDYDLWPQRAMQLKYKPFLDDVIEPLGQQEYNEADIRNRLESLFQGHNLKGNYFMNSSRSLNGQNRITIQAENNNRTRNENLIRNALNG